jgi:hypothetical protein
MLELFADVLCCQTGDTHTRHVLAASRIFCSYHNDRTKAEMVSDALFTPRNGGDSTKLSFLQAHRLELVPSENMPHMCIFKANNKANISHATHSQ